MKKLSILYVEDDVAVQKHISEFLQRYCQKVYLAQTAEHGYELYKKHQVDIIMSDINLPAKNGIDLAEKIRADDSDICIIIATAYTDKEFLLQAIELNLMRYLIKPITSDDLYGVFSKCIESMQLKNIIRVIDLGNGFSYHLYAKELHKGNEVIALRKKEIELLNFFIHHSYTIVTYEMLETMIWKDASMTQDAIRSQIKNLRKKIHPKVFTNISGVGYKLEYGES